MWEEREEGMAAGVPTHLLLSQQRLRHLDDDKRAVQVQRLPQHCRVKNIASAQISTEATASRVEAPHTACVLSGELIFYFRTVLSHRVDGNDTLAVYQVTKEARRIALEVHLH